MKITCQTSSLLTAVSAAARAVPAKTSKPILKCILIDAQPSSVEVRATDLEIGISWVVDEAIIEQGGTVALPAKQLVEMLKAIDGKEVTISSDGRFCDVRSEDVDYRLVTEDADDFPSFQADYDAERHSIPHDILDDMFARTGFCAAKDVGRYAINGILVDLADRCLRFVATDGRRLALAVRDVGKQLPNASVIVPTRFWKDALHVTSGAKTIALSVTRDHVEIDTDNARISCRTIEGEFPDYQQIIPQTFDARVTVETGSLLSAVEKVAVLAGDSARCMRVAIENETIRASSMSEGRGEAIAKIECSASADVPLSAEYNPDFLSEFLARIPSDAMVCLEYTNESSPLVLSEVETADAYILMPITTS